MDEQKLSPGSPDGMLAASARAGDLDAFRELYHRYVRHVHDYLLRSVHDPDTARDLTQSTFLRAHARLTTLRDPDRVREWLFALAYRLAVGQLRRGPVPVAVGSLPRAPGPRAGGEGAGGAASAGDLERSDLVWAAASSLPPELYAVIDVTARQGVDAGELADDSGLPRGEVIAQLERAHEAFGQSVRALLMSKSGEWCPGLASLLQTTDASTEEGRLRVDDHLGHCPRCRPLAERLITPATLSETPLHPLDPLLARDGWDMLVAELAKAAPRATRAALHQPEPDPEDTASLVASDSAMEYFAFPAPGVPRRETDMMRHESVRKAHAQAEHASFRTAALWASALIFVVAVVVAAIIVNSHHPPAAANLTRPDTSVAGTSSTAGTTAPSTSARPTTSRPTATTAKPSTTKPPATTKPTGSTVATVPAPVPIVTGMSPTSGFPGAGVTLTGSHFVSGDYVDFTGPTLPGGTEELTPTSMTPTQVQSNVPSFGTFAGQSIVVAVRNPAGVVSRSETFTVQAYWTGTWTTTNAKVSMKPSNAAYGTQKDGQVEVFQTDVESEQCMVDATAPVFLSTTGGSPIAVVPKTNTCPSGEFEIVGG